MTSELPIDPAVFPEKKYISTFSSGRRELGSVFHMMCYRYDQFLPPSRPQSTNHIPHPPWPQLATMDRVESGHDYGNWLVPSGSRKGGVVAKTRKCDSLDPFFHLVPCSVPQVKFRFCFPVWLSPAMRVLYALDKCTLMLYWLPTCSPHDVSHSCGGWTGAR